MTFEQWLEKQGFEAGELAEHQRGVLEAMFDRSRLGGLFGEPPADAAAARRAAADTLAAGKGNLEIVVALGPLELVAAESDADGEEPALPTFELLAYNGGPMSFWQFFHPVVFDLKGLRVSKRARPVFKEHDRQAIVGHTTGIEKATAKLTVAGVISGTGDAAREVVETSNNGFPWRISIGAQVEKMVFVEAGKTASANGQMFTGPVYIARKSMLGEISFVSLGADDDTSATVAASAAGDPKLEDTKMNFTDWLKAKGFDVAALSDEQRKFFLTAYEADNADTGTTGGPEDRNVAPTAPPSNAPSAPPTAAPRIEVTSSDDPGQLQAAAAVAAERDRVATIQAACRGFEGERVEELQDRAMRGEIELDDLRAGLIEHLRTERAQVTPTAQQADDQRKILLAVGYSAAMLPADRIIAVCGEPAMEAADRMRGIGLQEYCARAALTAGVELGRYQEDQHAWLQAAFSTADVPDILANVANKSLLEGYNHVDQSWRLVCKIASVKNFLEHSRHRLTGDFEFKKVGPDGELKHATISDQKFTNQADTFGIMFSLTRQMLINDNLHAFASMPSRVGRGAGDSINSAVWTLILSNPGSFFKTANKNYLTGATTALSISSLTAAEKLFLDQTKPDGTPLGVQPRVLLVPTGLKVTAEQLYKDAVVNELTTTNKPKPNSNPHGGKFTVACSPFLGNSSYTGNSGVAWYLFADANDVAAFEVAFLNGVDRPTVERADANFNTLGVQFRGFLDFGVKEQDYRGAVKMKGEA